MKLLTILLLGMIAQSVLAQSLILQANISPDGDKIAFSYQGDIWTVATSGGRADRLTIHEGYEKNPVWNDNSELIAFSSDRFGNDDVFVIPASGGSAQRLTYHSANDSVIGFTANNEVLFNSRRLYAQVEREPEVLTVSAEGTGTESRFMDALGFDASISPDGNKVAFVRGTARTSREDYRGPANRNIWIYDIKANSYEQLTDHAGADFMPKWIDNETIYFVSPRSGKYNVHSSTLKGRTQQITSETEFGINSFSSTAKGDVIVYQAGDKVVSLNIQTGSATTINIDVKSDVRFDPIVAKKVSNDIDQYAVSPNAKLSAYVVRGDIYVTRNDKEDSRSVRLTHGAARDEDVIWLNDNALIFVSDRAGNKDLYLLSSDDPEQPSLFESLKHNISQISLSTEDELSPKISHNGKRIAYQQGRGKLISADIDKQGQLSNSKVLLDGWDSPSGVSWSPDDRWLAYSLSDLNFNEEIYIHAADNSQAPVNVSMHPRSDINPVWSPDGSKLGFSSMRNNGDYDIWFAWLTKKDWQRSKEEWRRSEKRDNKKDTQKAKGKKYNDKEESDDKVEFDNNGNENKAKTEVAIVKIDFEGMYKRLQQVTRYTGNEVGLVFNQEGDHVYYSIGGSGRQNFEIDRNLYKIKWDGEDKETVLKGDVEPSNLLLADKGKSVFALTKGGKMVRISTKDDKSENLSVSSLTIIDHIGEREQIFDDAWRALDAGFYDPKFHGNDWTALREKYRPIALKASTKEDFQYIFNLMLGQLNASHMGLSRGDNQKQTQSQRTGLLGVEGIHTKNGFEITSVLQGSPASREESTLSVGDVITQVNQQAIGEHNFYSLFIDQADSPVLLSVQASAAASQDSGLSTSSEVVIWPTSSLSAELYDDWVETRRSLTDKYAKGRLGYLHIRGMNWSSFERFERELMAAGHGKEGIVIDVRYNGGGWTTDYLIAVLSVKQHSYTIPRGAANDLDKEHSKFKNSYPFAERLPLSAWTKPSIAISNENSYSNAEIFSHAYKALNLGKLVGRPTFGAVISTGSYRLVDGSTVRMPFRGWWEKGSGENMELVPAKPDIEVFNPPAYKASGIDPQLKRSVEELLKQVKRRG
jgi:C-terminal processing protease CtpA/Prc/Tol biopolymer transport system component